MRAAHPRYRRRAGHRPLLGQAGAQWRNDLGVSIADGASWALVGTATVTLPATALIGLAVSSHSTATLAAATFNQVTVSRPPVPAPWLTQDVGGVGLAGSASFDTSTSTYRIAGAGADIWGTADAFRYAYQPLAGDGTIVARVASVQSTNAWVKAGVMIRGDLTPGSAQAMMMVTPAKGNNFQRRRLAGGTTTSTAGLMVTAPYWVKLIRRGATLSAYQSSDGTTWSLVGTDTITLPANALVGLAVSSHSSTTLATATFDHVTDDASLRENAKRCSWPAWRLQVRACTATRRGKIPKAGNGPAPHGERVTVTTSL